MPPNSLPSEKETLLPITASPPVATPEPRKESKVETALFYICTATLLVLFAGIYYKDAIPALRPIAAMLSAGIFPSLWASLPAPALLFLGAPYFAEESKVAVVRYWIYLLYIVGVMAGAFVFGSQAAAMRCAVR